MSIRFGHELHDEDMRRALAEAHESLLRTNARPQTEKDVARKNLLRWLDQTRSSRAAKH